MQGSRRGCPGPCLSAAPGNARVGVRLPATLLAVTVLSALGACARPDLDRPGTDAGRLSDQWLVGGWVLSGESCESDGGVIHRPDGSWHADGASGTWHFDRGALAYFLTEAEDDLGRMKRLDPPVRYVERVEILGPDDYVARREDGSIRRLTRCSGG